MQYTKKQIKKIIFSNFLLKFENGNNGRFENGKTKEYTYELKDGEVLKSLIQEAEQYIECLSEQQKQKYENFKNKIVYNSDGSIDVNHPDTLKSFLAFKKLIKYKGEVPEDDDGRHNENSPFLGAYSLEYQEFKSKIETNLELKIAMKNFYESMYVVDSRFLMLSEADLIKSKPFAEKMLNDEMIKYNVGNKKTYKEIEYDEDFFNPIANKIMISSLDNPWNDWKIDLAIMENGMISGNRQFSKEVILLHELYHVKQTKPGEKENYGDVFSELGATIDLIVRADELHKYANDIPLDQVVNYENQIKFNGKNISPGLIANAFRFLKNKYNLETWEEVLLTNEGKKFVLDNFG